jgi:acyl carrier protein
MLALGGVIMIQSLMEKLVLEVVRGEIGDEAERLSLESDFDVLDVDQLTITHIVLALEGRLGIELPTNLENAQTVAELVTGAQEALRENCGTTEWKSQVLRAPSAPHARRRWVDRFGLSCRHEYAPRPPCAGDAVPRRREQRTL